MSRNTKHIAGILGVLMLCTAGVALASFLGNLDKHGYSQEGTRYSVFPSGIRAAQIITYTTTATARTFLNRESGSVFIAGEASDDPITFNLPKAEKGMVFTCIDYDATAAADLTINPNDADSILAQSAGVSFNATGDAVGESVTLLAVSTTLWIPIAKIGTWGQGS